MANESLLKVLTSTEEYLKICHDAEAQKWSADHFPEYWELVPEYVVSGCPYCNTPYVEKVDTYSLRNWLPFSSRGSAVFAKEGIKRRCVHFVVTQAFINFNGHKPEFNSDTEIELGSIHTFSEAPYLMKFLFERSPECKAVISALPLCKIESGEFVPRYFIYIVTYFTPHHWGGLMTRLFLQGYRPEHSENDTFWVWPDNENDDYWFDLSSAVESEDLAWLDVIGEKSVLRTGPIEKFPYGKIKGRRRPAVKIVTAKDFL